MDSEKYFISTRKLLGQVFFYDELFRKFNIFPLASEYILSALSFIVDGVEKF
jgi:hypothetical protein